MVAAVITMPCNAAEREPGHVQGNPPLLRTNPYAVLEGLLIAAEAFGAVEPYLAVKTSFQTKFVAVRCALGKIDATGSRHGLIVMIVAGPRNTSSVRTRRCSRSLKATNPCDGG
jgi:NADH:ubiquinone oxidoreductase subunit F (NADH-binding)